VVSLKKWHATETGCLGKSRAATRFGGSKKTTRYIRSVRCRSLNISSKASSVLPGKPKTSLATKNSESFNRQKKKNTKNNGRSLFSCIFYQEKIRNRAEPDQAYEGRGGKKRNQAKINSHGRHDLGTSHAPKPEPSSKPTFTQAMSNEPRRGTCRGEVRHPERVKIKKPACKTS